MHRSNTFYLFLFSILFSLGLLTGCHTQTAPKSTAAPSPKQTLSSDNTKKEEKVIPKSKERKKSPKKKASAQKEDLLIVHYIDVGQGDSTLITYKDHAMLIDAGDNSKGTAVQLYLQKQGITHLDYVIGTHPDSDHIGGLDVIIYKFHCKNIFLPDYDHNTATYRDVLSSIKAKNYKITHPKVNATYSLGSIPFTIVGPCHKYAQSNDNSIALRLTYQNNSFLFMGDTTKEGEKDIMASVKTLSSQVLKIGHHGSKYSTGERFLSRVSPTYAVISCKEGNSYGFPTARVLNLLRKNKVKVYRTDEQGTIVAKSDGKKISWNTSCSTTWKAGENQQHSTATQKKTYVSSQKEKKSPTRKSPKGISYVINTNTKKFHLPTCSSVKRMSEKNTKYWKSSRESLLKKGYSPCKICCP